MNSSTHQLAFGRGAMLLLLGLVTAYGPSAFALGETRYVQTDTAPSGFPLFDRTAAPIVVTSNDWPGVLRAANDLGHDIERVTGAQPQLGHELHLETQLKPLKPSIAPGRLLAGG